jgi:hypothetical protein
MGLFSFINMFVWIVFPPALFLNGVLLLPTPRRVRSWLMRNIVDRILYTRIHLAETASVPLYYAVLGLAVFVFALSALDTAAAEQVSDRARPGHSEDAQ